MLRVAALLVLLTVPLFALPTSAQTASTTRFIVSEGVDPADEAIIREGIRLAGDYATTALGIDPLSGVVITIKGINIDDRFVAMASSKSIVIQTGHPVWIETYPPLRRQQNPIHEYFHVIQRDLSNAVLPDSDMGPLWLVEGSAEYFGWQALIDTGIVSAEDIRAYHLSSVAFGQVMGPLASYEEDLAFYNFGNSYSLGYLAVEMLVQSAGITSLGEFYRELANAPDWQTAFTTAFGQTPDGFYQAFEEARWSFGSLVDPANPFLGSLQMPAYPVTGAYEVTLTAYDETVPTGGQGMVIGATAPGVVCTLDVTGADSAPVLSYPATADTLGKVFWLWSMPDDLDGDSVMLSVSCGGLPVVVEVAIT